MMSPAHEAHSARFSRTRDTRCAPRRRALETLRVYPWRGNVRELENIIERAVVLCDGPSIQMHHLPGEVVQSAPAGGQVSKIPGASLADIERHAILETLNMVGGSTTVAAKVLGISVRKIQYRLQEYAEAPEGKASALRSVCFARHVVCVARRVV